MVGYPSVATTTQLGGGNLHTFCCCLSLHVLRQMKPMTGSTKAAKFTSFRVTTTFIDHYKA